MIHILFASVFLWLAVGTGLWAYLGVLAASRSGVSIPLGALVGALTWCFGVAAILVFGGVRQHGGSDRARSRTGDPFAVPGASPGAYSSFAGDRFAAAVPPSNPYRPTSFDPFADAGPALPAPSYPPAVRTSRLPLPALGARGSQAVLAGALAVFGFGLLISTFLPWGDGGVAWSHGRSHFDAGVAPIDAAPVAIALVGSGLVVIAAAVMAWRDPRGTPLAIAVVVAAWWFWLISEWFVADDDVHIVTSKIDSAIGGGTGGHVRIDYGTWVAYVSCVGIVGTSVFGAVMLISMRSSGGGGVRA